MARKTALVVAPGRGTYNKPEHGYLGRYHADKTDMLEQFDALRRELGQTPIMELDGAKQFSLSLFTRGDNASPLIYSCAYADYHAIDQEKFEIVAVTGNSMGWYIALACVGALDAVNGFHVVNTMGTLMQETLIGGQILYPFVDDNWVEIPGRKSELLALADDIYDLHISIDLGGMIVFAGSEEALKTAERHLPPLDGRFPMHLGNHAGFHSPLQIPVALKGKNLLPPQLFERPTVPLIDGRGHLWQPKASKLQDLWNYTLGHQVIETYDFTAAIRNGLRTFAPDVVIILGPGTTLGGAVAQAAISTQWLGMTSKTDFKNIQDQSPFILSMGDLEQRALVTP